MNKNDFVSLFSDSTNKGKSSSGQYTREDYISMFADPKPKDLEQNSDFQTHESMSEPKKKETTVYDRYGVTREQADASAPQYTTSELLQAANDYTGSLYSSLREEAKARSAQTQQVRDFEVGKDDSELMRVYADKSVKLNDAQLETAKRLVEDFQNRYDNAQNMDPINGTDTRQAYQYAAMMNDPQYQDYLQLKNKVDGFSAATAGFTEGTGLSELIHFTGFALGDDEDKAAMDAWRDDRNAVSAAGSVQNPIAYGAGYLGGKMAEYAVGRDALKAVPGVGNALQKLGTAANTALNSGTKAGAVLSTLFPAERITGIASDQILDLLLDTTPQVAEDIMRMNRQQREGVAEGEEKLTPFVIGGRALGNFSTNLGYNLLGEVPGMIGDARKNLPDALKAQGALDALDEGITPTAQQVEAYNRYAARNGLEGSENWYDINMSQKQEPFLSPVKQADEAPNSTVEIDGTLKNEYNNTRGDFNGTDPGAGFGGTESGGAGAGTFDGQAGGNSSGNQRVFRQSVSNPEAYSRAGATTQELVDSTSSPEYFSAQLDRAIKENKNGLMVSPKTPQELAESGAITFMSKDGMSGAAVTADGDIEAVFRIPGGEGKRLSYQMIITAVDNGGVKLDCYGADLVNNYNRLGFEPVARVAWNPEYAPDGWTYGPKDVYVMKLQDGLDAAQIEAKLGLAEADGGFHLFTDEELNALPVMDYDEALAYRDSLIKNSPAQTSADAIPTRVDGSASVSAPFNYGISPSVGAMESNTARYSNMQNTYGTIAPGENPSRVVDVPFSTNGSDRVSRFARTAMEAEATPDSMLKNYESYVEQGLFSYKPKKDKAALNTAVRNITQNGYQRALDQWQQVVDGFEPVTKENMVLAQLLYAEAAKAGDTDTAMRLAAEIAAEGTNLGQSIQAMRLLKKMTPEGQLYYVQKVVDKLNRDLLNGKNTGIGISGAARQAMQSGQTTLKIPKELADQLLGAKTAKEISSASEAIFNNIAQQLPADWATKWNAWRYLSMLGNPRTHIRNIIGNAVFYPARKIKDMIGAGLESAVIKDTAGRTKAILNPFDDADKARKAFAAADFDDGIGDMITSGGKLNPENIIKENQTVFTSKTVQPLEWLRKANSAALDAEDTFFLRNAYTDSLAGYMKAQGLAAEDMTGAVLEKARSYAIEQAQKATYRDASALASALNRFTQTNTATRIIGGSLFPFTKTPINIMKRGLEYSPVGVGKGVWESLVSVRKGTKTMAQAIEDLSAGLTGTGLIALGAYLGYNDVLTASGSDNKKEATFGDLTGQQEYAVKVGDGSYTLDWAAPTSLPVFVGAELGKMLKEENGLDLPQILDAISGISDPMINMTMLQGINNTIKAAGYGENAIGELAINAATGYASQAVPTVFGQIARAVDDTRRTTYTESGQPLSGISKTLQKAENKIPGLSMMNQPYVDPWGRTEENVGGNFLGRLAYNMLSPGYYEGNNTTQVDSILNELYQETGESSVLPGYASKTWTQNGEKHSFTADEYIQYSMERGQTAYSILEELTPMFAQLEPQQAVYATEKVYDIANQLAKQEVVGVPLDNAYQNIVDAAGDYDGGIAELLFAKAVMYDVEGEKDRNGDTISGSVKRNKIQALVDAGYSRSEATKIYELLN